MKRIHNTCKSWAVLAILVCSISSCKKFLDKKPNENLGILSTLNDVQLFLDNFEGLNQQKYPEDGETSSDLYHLNVASYNSLEPEERNVHSWNKYSLGVMGSWQGPYGAVFLSNIALDELEEIDIKSDQLNQKNKLRGSALFFRSFYLHAVIQIYTLPYNKITADADLGIPLRLDPDFKTVSTRSTLQESFNQITADLREAASLLPDQDFPLTRPNKTAAYALLARVYLSKSDYDSVGFYANKSLQLYSSLMEYSDLSTTSISPIPKFNKEILFWSTSTSPSALSTSNAKIDLSLYQSYTTDDLRKAIFFRANTGANAGTFSWKGGYNGSGTYVFGGLATDEVYLMRAESYARAGNKDLAMKDLNDLLKTRWRKENGITTYVDQTATDANDALIKILAERKKELPYRGLRWLDMRRLSLEPAFATTYKRLIDNQTYELVPGSPRYALQIPLDVIQRTGMPQNP